MATIALYAGKINQMTSLTGEVKKSVDDYSSELFSLKSKALNIRKSVCDLDDVIGMIQASTQIQEKKIESLENFSQKAEEFTAEVVRIDEEVAAVINQNKEDFYNKYDYLKPDAEKSFLEICFDSAAEWCKEHWKEILIGLSFIVIGALLSWITGGAFLPMLLSGLKAALASGAITGGINAGISLVSSLVQGDGIGTIIGNSLNAFGDGFAGGFMLGGIMTGTSMALSSGFRMAGKLGARAGRRGGGTSNRGGNGASGAKQSIVTPEIESKILEGQRVGTTNRVKGGHSPNINNANPNYATETIKTYTDGTKQIKYVKQFTDGNVSKIKTSTIFPDGWSDSKIISSIKEVGNSTPIGYRARDGATIFRSTTDGVQVEVIKIRDSVISGYPTGGGATGLPAGFTGK